MAVLSGQIAAAILRKSVVFTNNLPRGIMAQ
jgi:hypothetical protein